MEAEAEEQSHEEGSEGSEGEEANGEGDSGSEEEAEAEDTEMSTGAAAATPTTAASLSNMSNTRVQSTLSNMMQDEAVPGLDDDAPAGSAGSSSSSSTEKKRVAPESKSSEPMVEEGTEDKKDEILPPIDNDGFITLIAKGGVRFENQVTRRMLGTSNTLRTSIEADLGEIAFPVPGIAPETMPDLIKYLQHHNGKELAPIPSPLRSREMKDVVFDPFDAEFINEVQGRNSQQPLYDLILAANYLDIRSLLHLGCAKVASLIKGKTKDEMKAILRRGLPPLTKEQEAELDAKEKAEDEKAAAAVAVAAK